MCAHPEFGLPTYTRGTPTKLLRHGYIHTRDTSCLGASRVSSGGVRKVGAPPRDEAENLRSIAVGLFVWAAAVEKQL
jgi:hypothetical protein